MDSDQSNQQNSSEQVNQDQEEQGKTQDRPYECTFCRRGFSNAQALGGHMNIHRKDKAKLKHSTPTEQSLDNTSKINFPSSFSAIPTTGMGGPLMEPKSSKDRSSSMMKWAWSNLDDESDTSKKNKAHVGEIQQFSLFVDQPSSEDQGRRRHHQHQEEEAGTLYERTESHGLSSSEVDLELRLGPEPQFPPPATGTKRFF